MKTLTLKDLQHIIYDRSKNYIKVSNNWTPLEWGGALAGEVGELCNKLKKARRGESIDKMEIAYEMADIITYINLMASNLDIDLENSVIEKFNIVSDRWNCNIKL